MTPTPAASNAVRPLGADGCRRARSRSRRPRRRPCPPPPSVPFVPAVPRRRAAAAAPALPPPPLPALPLEPPVPAAAVGRAGVGEDRAGLAPCSSPCRRRPNRSGSSSDRWYSVHVLCSSPLHSMVPQATSSFGHLVAEAGRRRTPCSAAGRSRPADTGTRLAVAEARALAHRVARVVHALLLGIGARPESGCTSPPCPACCSSRTCRSSCRSRRRRCTCPSQHCVLRGRRGRGRTAPGRSTSCRRRRPPRRRARSIVDRALRDPSSSPSGTSPRRSPCPCSSRSPCSPS